LATVSRKDAILEAARAEFAEYGYSGARIERVAASAKSNKQLIFHYFGSKDGLYTSVVASAFASAPTPPAEVAIPSDGIRGFLGSFAEWLMAMPGAALTIVECAPGRHAPPAAAVHVSTFLSRTSLGLRKLIDEGQRKGFYRDDVDWQQIVNLAVGSIVAGELFRATGSGLPSEPNPGAVVARMVIDYCEWR